MMRAEKQWVDHPEATPKSPKRPHLRLVKTPEEASPVTPTEKAVNSISAGTEIMLVILAQSVLIIGLFMAYQFMG